jgi:hypothetical protein
MILSEKVVGLVLEEGMQCKAARRNIYGKLSHPFVYSFEVGRFFCKCEDLVETKAKKGIVRTFVEFCGKMYLLPAALPCETIFCLHVLFLSMFLELGACGKEEMRQLKN